MLNMGSAPDDLTARARIRDAAIELFGRDGFERARVRDIAERAGVSAALVLHHFGSKEQLRHACDEHVTSALFARKELLQGAAAAAEIQAWLADFEGNRPQLTYIARMLTGDSGAGAQLFAALVAGTRQMMDEQIDAGVMRDVPDRDVVAAHLATWGVAPLVLGQHLAAALGADEMSGELYRRSTLPLMDVLTHGIYTDDRLFRTAQEVLEP